MSTTGLNPIVATLLRHFVAMVGALALASYLAIYWQPRAPLPIRSDGYSYYVYLPSWFLYGDFTLQAPARDCCGGVYPQFTGMTRWPRTGQWINPHPIGAAVLMAPFFLAGHALTWWSNLPPDGFSLYYQHAAGLAGVSYLLAGLALLRRTLRRHFTPATVLAALIAITWGTNLFHYGVFDATFSHVYSFFLICLLMALTERWWSHATLSSTLALGIVAALVVLTRHTNALFLLIVPFYGVATWPDLQTRAAGLWSRRGEVALMVAVAGLGVWPQLAIYHRATGSWFVSPYGLLDVGFRFRSPHLSGVLFSTEKGLFFWSPLLLLSVAGMCIAMSPARSTRSLAHALVWPAVAILALDTYLIASWSDWQFGGSYGHRGFTDGLGLLAVFLAAFFEWAAHRPRLNVVIAVGSSLAVTLSIVQMIQYWGGVVPIANTTWDQYRALFLRFR